jgi:hypothetical protein
MESVEALEDEADPTAVARSLVGGLVRQLRSGDDDPSLVWDVHRPDHLLVESAPSQLMGRSLFRIAPRPVPMPRGRLRASEGASGTSSRRLRPSFSLHAADGVA